MAFYDLEGMRNLSILDVCDAYDIEYKKQGKNYFCKLRPDEKTASCCLNVRQPLSNDWFKDHGSGKAGDVITFVAEHLHCDRQAAIESLALVFGFEDLNNTQYMKRNELSDYEYSKIGIYGDLATKNFDFDLEKHSLEAAAKFEEKYRMPVNQLRTEFPREYERNILRKKAIPYVFSLRNQYYFDLYCHISLEKAVIGHFDVKNLPERLIKESERTAAKVAQAEKLLRRALEGTNINYKFKNYDVVSDLDKIAHGKISFEIGRNSYYEVNAAAFRQKIVVLGVKKNVPYDTYASLNKYGINSIFHAAHLENDMVNLSFLPEQEKEIEHCFELYNREKEINALAEKIAAQQSTLRDSFAAER